MPTADGMLRFYQCFHCNAPDRLWSETVVYASPSQYKYYSVIVNTDGSFQFSATDPNTWQSTTVNIAKASWMPNVYGGWGYITLAAGKGINNDGGSGSYIYADAVKARYWG